MRLIHALSIPRFPDGTNLLGFFWATSFIYERLWTLAIPVSVPSFGWTGAAISLGVVWSVMDRRRWARLVLVGIAAITLAGLAGAALPMTSDFVPFRIYAARLLPHYAVIVSDTMHWDAAIVVSLATLCWLLRKSVRQEFEIRKRRELYAWQRGIAVALLFIWGLCQWGSAPQLTGETATATAGYNVMSSGGDAYSGLAELEDDDFS